MYARAKARIRGTGLYSFTPSLLRISEVLFLKQTTGRCVGCMLVGGLGPPPAGQLFEVCRNALGLPLPGLPWILAAVRPGRGYCSPETGGQAPPGPPRASRARAACFLHCFSLHSAGSRWAHSGGMPQEHLQVGCSGQRDRLLLGLPGLADAVAAPSSLCISCRREARALDGGRWRRPCSGGITPTSQRREAWRCGDWPAGLEGGHTLTPTSWSVPKGIRWKHFYYSVFWLWNSPLAGVSAG